MTSPDLPQQPPTHSAEGDAPIHTPDARQTPAATPNEATASSSEPHGSQAAAAHATDDGPQPGNVAPGGEPDDGGDDDEGPAPGNERLPGGGAGASGQGAPGAPGTGKRKRRRRKKGGAGAPGAQAGANAQAGQAGEAGGAAAAPGSEGATEGGDEHAEGAEAKEGQGPAGKKKRKKPKKDAPQRERPAFNVGDVTFGKIVEITDDAIFVDLSGKGRAIFDRRELDLPDEDPNEQFDDELDEPAVEPSAEAAPSAEGAGEPAAEAAPTEAAAPEAAPAEATPAEAAPTEASRESAPEAATEAAPAEAPAGESAGESGAEPADANAAPARQVGDPTTFPPVVLELGTHFVGIVHNDGGRGGLVVLTRHPKRARRAKLVVAGAFKEKGEVFGLVTGVIKGGVEVDVDGLRAFAPGSHMDLRLGADLHPLVGKRLLFQVTQYAKKGRDVVLSRRAFLEIEARAAREEALKRVEVGKIVDGVVRSVVSFGAFIDIGGIEGLVPLSEMSHNRGDGPHDVFKQNETVQVKILRVDEKGKIWLSRRAAIPDPWGDVAKKYAMGTRHTGKVARLQPFGAFVELESGIDGLIHTADLSMKRIEHPSEVVKEGDTIEVVVAHLDVGAHKIGLHPAPVGAAADEAPQRVQVHKPVKVAVVGHDAGGLFVRILGATGRHARGFITAASTGTPRGTDLRKQFPLNTQLDAKVMELDPKRSEVKLSIRALSEDTERTAYRQYREQVTREAKFGTFADLLKKKG